MDVAIYPALANSSCGQPAEGEALARTLLGQAERIGHKNIVSVCKIVITAGRLAAGDLEGAWREGSEALAFGLSLPGGGAWTFVDQYALATIAAQRGDRAAALLHYQGASKTEPDFFCAGFVKPALFAFLARAGDPGAAAALEVARQKIHSPGPLNSFGSWGGIAQLIEGLVALGRQEEAAGEFTRAEEHHNIAIHQADTAQYRVMQPNVRERCAEMLILRWRGSDKERARLLLGEAQSLYSSLGMSSFARRAGETASGLV